MTSIEATTTVANTDAGRGTPSRQGTPGELRDRMLARVEERLAALLAQERAYWSEQNPDALELVDCVGAMVESGGKRLRPAFCIAAYLAAGGDPESQVAVDAAAALELMHTSALLHDDVLDESELRRGGPTAHVLHATLHRERDWHGDARHYGQSVAMLAGNLAIVYAERLLAHCPPAARSVWGELSTELMVGQFLDVRAAARFQPDIPLARWIALFKSGRYTVYRPLAVGAMLAGGSPELLTPFEEYGLALGEAFQLRDDLLDAFGDTDITGKPARLDFKQHKMTLLMSFALQDEPEVKALVGDDLPNTDPEELHALLLKTGMKDRVESVIEERLKVANDAVSAALPAEWAAELHAMARAAAYRVK
ncbi:polyprenyl synthetase family protein [Streptomyces sp. 71268]|uniref:polyprenyl synthetase family protein n=1 Tax=Streptomyces sp. 71268 TaxID=3002640 RepID=UPI0023F619FC|nr:polyprenyl synthetase family protein [Streptomyces sp. 71268]WEV25380.1 polyprenyl synthetase family protein [Streptomyces sp. 71268]